MFYAIIWNPVSLKGIHRYTVFCKQQIMIANVLLLAKLTKSQILFDKTFFVEYVVSKMKLFVAVLICLLCFYRWLILIPFIYTYILCWYTKQRAVLFFNIRLKNSMMNTIPVKIQCLRSLGVWGYVIYIDITKWSSYVSHFQRQQLHVYQDCYIVWSGLSSSLVQ